MYYVYFDITRMQLVPYGAYKEEAKNKLKNTFKLYLRARENLS